MADPQPALPASSGQPGSGSTSVPSWLSHVAAIGWRVLVVLALVAILLAIARLLIVTTASIVLVGMIAATALPLHRNLLARGWSRTRAAGVTWLAAWGALALTVILVVLPLAAVAVDVFRAVVDSARALAEDLNQANLAPVSTALAQVATAVSDWMAAEVSSVVGAVTDVVSVVVLSFFLSFFVILDIDRGMTWVLQFVPSWSRADVRSGANQAIEQVGGFVRDAAVTSVVRTAIVFVAMLALGVPYSAALAAIVFLGGFVPFLGGIASTSAVFVVALTQTSAIAALLLLALIIAIDLSFDRLMARAGVRRSTRLHPAVVLAVLLIGAAVAGVVGLFAAVPVAAFMTVLAGPLRDALGSDPGTPAGESTIVPPWLDRIAQWSWRILIALALMLAAVAIAAQVPLLAGALLLAAILAATLAPLNRALRRRGMSNTAAALGTTGGAATVTAVVLGLTVATLIAQAAQLAINASDGSGGADQAGGGQLGWLVEFTNTSGAAIVVFLAAASGSLAGVIIAVALACVLTFFLLRDGASAWELVSSRVAGWRRKRLDEAGTSAVNTLGGYMIATGVLSAFGGITQWLVMFVLGIPLALPLAVLSFFGGFIPYIGSFITTGLAFLVTVALGSTQDVIFMAIFTVVFNLVQGSVLGPLVYGKAVSIHPAVVLIAIPVGAALAGIVGMFLVIPVLGIIATTWRTVLAAFGDPAAAPIRPTAPEVPVDADVAGTLVAET